MDDKIPTDLAFYRPRLDEIVDVFGIDRVLYGSDWPNGDQWLPVPVGFKIVHEYFMGKGQAAAEKYFWRNSIKAYKWVKRTPASRRLNPIGIENLVCRVVVSPDRKGRVFKPRYRPLTKCTTKEITAITNRR